MLNSKKIMNESSRIVTNESYKDLFKQDKGFNQDQYPIPQPEEYDILDNNNLTKALALFFQKQDSNRQAFYGIEIKSNGGSRSNRIPLVRVAGKKSSIWKISSKIEDLEKTILALDKLVYFLKNNNDQDYPIPLKIVVLRDNENCYATPSSPHYRFVKDITKKSGVILFSFQFIKNLIENKSLVDLDSHLRVGMIFTIALTN